MYPSILGENLFDDFFNDPFGMMASQGESPLFGKHAKNMMKTDVRETESAYELDIDLKNGYLTIGATKGLDKDEQDKNGRYIRRERYAGTCSRSFYVGDVQPSEIGAKYEDGILKLSVPKADKRRLPEKTTIAIE